MAIPHTLDGVVYSIAPHRNATGHFATWECVTCGTAGGMSRVCADDNSAVEAARQLIAAHHARSHFAASSGELFSLAYSSQAVQGFSKASLDELAQRAAAKNALLDVTGYLTFDVDFETFFQFLEGPKSVVETLMNVISDDPRHRVLKVVRISEAERQFAAASFAASAWSAPPAEVNAMAGHAELRMFSSWRMKLITRSDFQVMDMEDLVIDVLASMRKADLGGEYVTGPILEMSNQLRFRAPLAML